MRYIFSIDKRHGGLLQQLKTRLLLSGSLLIFVLLIHISVNIYITSMQNTLQTASQLDLHQQQSWAEHIDTLATLLTLVLSLLVILVLWQAFVQLGRALHQQLQLLENSVTSLRDGDMSTRIPSLSSQELDHLGKRFNTLAEALQQQSASILAQKNREQEQVNLALRIQRDELRVLNTALEETNLARSQFLSIMTHELRTPLTAMLGFSQIVLRAMEHEQSHNRSNIERVLKNGQHLLHLMNDALELINLESGHMSITISQVPLSTLLSEVIENTQCMIAEKPLTLTSTLDPAIDEIESDPDKLRQILLILVSNAIKFTEEGEIHITTKKYSDSENEGEQILISIHDTGIGIAPEIQERIFEAFYQGDSSITRKYSGTGLGLSIVHQLTLLLGGTLVLDSTLGQGSTFTLLLPQHPPIAEPNRLLSKPQLAMQAHLRHS